MPRGGRRAGTPGKAYKNRSDLNETKPMPVQAGPSQQYGQRAAAEAAQRAVPMSAPQPTPAPAPQQAPMAPRTPPTPLDAETTRPGEPLTTGIASGPGAGPEALGLNDPTDDPIEAQLRALYARYPNEELRELLEDLER